MPHVAAHSFRPLGSDTAAQRVICAEPGCYLTPDEHMEAMARALEATPRKGRPLNYDTQAERKRLGHPVCEMTPGCPRAPTKGRKSCPRCRAAKAATRRAELPPGPQTTLRTGLSVAMAGQVALAAERERISGAEWVRRAIAEKLDRNAPMDSPANGI